MATDEAGRSKGFGYVFSLATVRTVRKHELDVAAINVPLEFPLESERYLL